MTERVVVAVAAGDTPRYRWFERDEPREGPAAEVASVARGAEVTLLLGSAYVLLTDVSVKARNRRLLLNAVPYALEDHLATDVEDLRVVTGEPVGPDRYAVAVATDAVIGTFENDLRGAGVALVRIRPYALAIPLNEGGAAVFGDGSTTVVRTGRAAGFTAPAPAVSDLLSRALADAPADTIEYVRAGSASVLTGASTQRALPGGSVDTWLCGNSAESTALELGSVRRERHAMPWRRLAAAAMLFLVALLLHTGFELADARTAEARLEALRDETETVFRTAFPDVRRIVNPRVQAARLLAERSASGPAGIPFLEGLHTAGAAIDALDDDTRLTAIRYQRGRFDLSLDTPDIATLERLRTAMGPRFVADIVSAENRDERVAGRVRIEAVSP